MSYTTMMTLGQDGIIHDHQEFGNSHLFAPVIWSHLTVKWLKEPPIAWMLNDEVGGENGSLWRLLETHPLEQYEKAVLILTLGGAILRKENFGKMAEMLFDFAGHVNPNGRLLEIVGKIAQLKSDPDCMGICFHHTSVTDNPWWIVDYDNDADEGRPYDVNIDTHHFFVFDLLSEVLND